MEVYNKKANGKAKTLNTKKEMENLSNSLKATITKTIEEEMKPKIETIIKMI